MIDYISGKVISLAPTNVVIDNNGIGYGIEISLQTYDVLNGKNEALLYIQRQINPRDGMTVDYGFATQDERELFRSITGVSGMGAASARMILSSMSADEFREAVLSEDVNRLKSIKGIGLKSAQRMVLELKDKIIKGTDRVSDTIFNKEKNSSAEEAASALQLLGFSKPNISKAILSILKESPSAEVEEIIKKALRML